MGVHRLPLDVPVERPWAQVLAAMAEGGPLLRGQDILLYPSRHEVSTFRHRTQDDTEVPLQVPDDVQHRPTDCAKGVPVDQSRVPDSDGVRVCMSWNE